MAGLCTDLKGKVVIVTGASSGIGAATAVQFAKLGSQLVITGRNAENLQKTAKKCFAAGLKENEVLSMPGDVTNAEFRKDLVKGAVDKFGKLNVLVNNAGIMKNGTLMATGLDVFDQTFDVNVRAVVDLTKECVPHLLKVKGSIVNVSSIAGTRSFYPVAYYCMSKAALDQFTKCLALELASQGVRVNSVNPAMIETELFVRTGASEEQVTQLLEHAKTTHPIGRIGQPEEVAKAIVFLASEEASFTTGNTTFVDGGREKVTPR